jgi:hypothetical protein
VLNPILESQRHAQSPEESTKQVQLPAMWRHQVFLSIPFSFFLSFSFVVLGLKLKALTLSHYSNHFCDGYFLGSVSLTICPGWL